MDNQLLIYSNNINVHAVFLVKGNIMGKLVLGFLNLVILLAFVAYAMFQFSSMSVFGVIAFLIAIVFYCYFPLRYLLWNIYGKEHVLITTKSLSFWREYGFFRTRETNYLHKKMHLNFQTVIEQTGLLQFLSVDEKTGMLNPIFQTTVLIEEEMIAALEIEIAKLYEQEIIETNGFAGYTLN